jgi:hypothetical protein
MASVTLLLLLLLLLTRRIDSIDLLIHSPLEIESAFKFSYISRRHS